MFSRQPKPSEISAQIKTEYTPSSPAMRLTLVKYMTEFGIPQTFEGTPEQFLEMLLAFVSEGYEAFTAELDAIYVDEVEETQDTDGEVIDFPDPNRSPYL